MANPSTIHLEVELVLDSGWGVCGQVGVFMFFQRHVVPKVIYMGSVQTMRSLLFLKSTLIRLV